MSTTPENELDLELQLLPAWAKESPQTNRYANFEGRDDRRHEFDDRRPPRGDRRDSPPRRDGPGRPQGAGAGPGGPRPGGPRTGARRDGPPGGGARGGRPGRGGERFGGRRDDRPREPLIPLPELHAEVLPEHNGVESITRQIKLTGRAFPLFEVAALFVKRPERYVVQVKVVKKPDGSVAQPLFQCSLDDSLWLSEAEAVAHALSRHFNTFYQAEKTPCDPPKGIYTFVAQCGLSGEVLGPPNYHDYQIKIHKLHTERFSRMPFEVYKSRVKMVKDEAVVKQWVEEQSFKTEYVCLNVPDALRLPSREEVEKHFRTTHAANVVRPVTTHTFGGEALGTIRAPGLRALVRRAVDEQQRFPMQLANVLSGKFAGAGLQFFKVNKTITHVSIARPHYLDLEAEPVSDGVRRIIEFLNANLKCTRKKLIEALAPSPAPAPIPVPLPVTPPAEGAPAAEAVAPQPKPAPEPTPEQAALIGDLHWLIHQGHVIEFANGQLETAKKPLPRPEPAPAKKPAAATGYLPVFLVSPLLVGE